MSATYDMEAAEPNMGQLRERVKPVWENPVNVVDVRPLSGADRLSTSGVV